MPTRRLPNRNLPAHIEAARKELVAEYAPRISAVAGRFLADRSCSLNPYGRARMAADTDMLREHLRPIMEEFHRRLDKLRSSPG